MRSVFTFKALLLIVLGIAAVLLGLTGYVVQELVLANDLPILFSLFILAFLGLIFTWLFFGEFRTKAVRVELLNEEIIVRRYGGLGKPRMFSYDELDGFRTSMLTANTGEYEYLYLLRNDRKVAKISEFYHKNYPELKTFIITRLTYLGTEDFSLMREFKESFSRT